MGTKDKSVTAIYWRLIDQETVQCQLCPHFCLLKDKESGLCRKRTNHQQILYTENFGLSTGLQIDPIEKKPLYHYHPGSQIVSLGPNSCNLSCQFCQNYQSSQKECHTIFISPENLLQYCLEQDIRQVAFTYSEPITWIEYILACGELFKDHQVKIVMVSNGFINQEPLSDLLRVTSAWNIDLKAFSNPFYQTICGARLNPVLETIQSVAQVNHLEITHLLIEGLNDHEDEFYQMLDFIASVNKDIPLHISRYFPRYQLDLPPTHTMKVLDYVQKARQILNYVYPGNVLVDEPEVVNTLCPNCHALIINRFDGKMKATLDNNKYCKNCSFPIYGDFL